MTVLLAHFNLLFVGPGTLSFADGITPWQVFLPVGMVWVSFFFVLSGFVMTWSARDGDTARGFWRRRFWKVYPDHVVTLVFMVVLLLATGISAVPGLLPAGVSPVGSLANLFLVHTWLPAPDLLFSGTTVNWSLAAELLFYLLFPALLPLVKRIPADRLWLAFGIAVAAVWAVPVIAESLPGPDMAPSMPMSFGAYWVAYFLPLGRLPEFLVGMVLARIVRGGFLPRLGVVLPGALVLVALTAGALLLPTPFLSVAVTIVPVALVVAAAASTDLRGVATLWNRPATVFLGDITLAYYLVHYPILLAYRHFVGVPEGTVALLATAALLIVVCGVVAWLLFRFVEEPLMRRFGSAPRKPVPDMAAGR